MGNELFRADQANQSRIQEAMKKSMLVQRQEKAIGNVLAKLVSRDIVLSEAVNLIQGHLDIIRACASVDGYNAGLVDAAVFVERIALQNEQCLSAPSTSVSGVAQHIAAKLMARRNNIMATDVDFDDLLHEIPNCPVIKSCVCYASPECCFCGKTEKALRAWSDPSNWSIPPMSPLQRDWCLREIDKVEGYSKSDYLGESDAHLARGVLAAWQEYCRDKGLI